MKAVVIGESSGATMEIIMTVYPRHKVVVDKFIARGEVIGIGPFSDRGNMAIFKTRAAAEQFAAEDPFILEGLVKSFVIRDWNDTMIPSNEKEVQSKSYTVTIEVAQSPEIVFNHITEVSKWWSRDFKGNSSKLNDEFVIDHPGRHYSKQRLVEIIPNQKMVWLVTESLLNWLEKDQHEWTHTKMIFEISVKADKTAIHFTHEGLVPGKECYAMCEQGWNMVIKERLYNYMTDGKTI